MYVPNVPNVPTTIHHVSPQLDFVHFWLGSEAFGVTQKPFRSPPEDTQSSPKGVIPTRLPGGIVEGAGDLDRQPVWSGGFAE